MSKGWDITNNVERRIAEAKQGTSSHIAAKSLDVPVHQPRVHAKVALPTGKTPVVRPSKHPALTKRERKVKDILLQELQRLSEWKTLNYAEKKHLDETINVVYIDMGNPVSFGHKVSSAGIGCKVRRNRLKCNAECYI